MNTSDTIDKIAPAFVKAQMECESAKKSNENGAFRNNGKASKYAGLPEVIEACLPACHANGIGVLQVLGDTIDGKMGITTRLLHISGQWIEGVGSIPLPKQDPQGYGSASTYALAAINAIKSAWDQSVKRSGYAANFRDRPEINDQLHLALLEEVVFFDDNPALTLSDMHFAKEPQERDYPCYNAPTDQEWDWATSKGFAA